MLATVYAHKCCKTNTSKTSGRATSPSTNSLRSSCPFPSPSMMFQIVLTCPNHTMSRLRSSQEKDTSVFPDLHNIQIPASVHTCGCGCGLSNPNTEICDEWIDCVNMQRPVDQSSQTSRTVLPYINCSSEQALGLFSRLCALAGYGPAHDKQDGLAHLTKNVILALCESLVSSQLLKQTRTCDYVLIVLAHKIRL